MIIMKMSARATEARRKILDNYPTAKVVKYQSLSLGGRYGVFVPAKDGMSNGTWLELTKDNSSTKEKAWIGAHKSILQNFLKMLEF
jgi:hypothetical protein